MCNTFESDSSHSYDTNLTLVCKDPFQNLLPNTLFQYRSDEENQYEKVKYSVDYLYLLIKSKLAYNCVSTLVSVCNQVRRCYKKLDYAIYFEFLVEKPKQQFRISSFIEIKKCRHASNSSKLINLFV